ncbi:metalloregulator ArsR/SmtB family transcription factor [Streptomyces shenzhenensis]|uniref:Transcriptional regulator n=1 Tax=Streptomyces shenzhenensis TaxID=943815 RepID=A0A3M0IBZ2_9ACTN|nr:metalloregulator ArsR/SmtB family transcription factor [Streptomyces shenzhenensis]RMB85580.1 transcriptional regulator [Streptomyces shenzhenensis]
MRAQVASWDEERAERSVSVLKAVADPSRYRLLWALSERELPVSRLAELIGAHVAATSQHLAKLRALGLVLSRREGTRIYYRAAGPRVRALLESAVLAADEAALADTAASPEPVRRPEPALQEARTPARTPRPAPGH